jgi:FemAB-related protein (PEP-CTERM system-associated)
VIAVRFCEDGEEKAWDEYVYRCPEASQCHLSGWRRVIEQTYGHRAFYLWAWDEGQICGVLPLILMGGMVFSRSLVSMPFLDDGGICADNDQARAALYQEAVRLSEQQKAGVLDLRHRQPNTLALTPNGAKTTLVLELPIDAELLWRGFDAKLRNQIRKAIKSGLTASWGGPEKLFDFYDAFAWNMRDLGSPVHSREFFANIFQEFAGDVRFMLVRQGEVVIGGAVCFSFHDTLLVPWASSRKEYLSRCPNNLLYWEMIRWGCENGYRRLDFGRSSPGSGTYRFKRQWGTKEEPLHWQCLSKENGRQTLLHSDNPKYQWVIRAWQCLPMPVTKVLGPLVRGQISS